MQQISVQEIEIRLGLNGLPATEKQAVMGAFFSLLELRVGKRLATVMPKSAIDQFDHALDSEKDRVVGLNLLERTIPEYGQIVQQEFDLAIDEFWARYQAAEKGST